MSTTVPDETGAPTPDPGFEILEDRTVIGNEAWVFRCTACGQISSRYLDPIKAGGGAWEHLRRVHGLTDRTQPFAVERSNLAAVNAQLRSRLAAAEERYQQLAAAVRKIAAELADMKADVPSNANGLYDPVVSPYRVAERLRALAATAPPAAPSEQRDDELTPAEMDAATAAMAPIADAYADALLGEPAPADQGVVRETGGSCTNERCRLDRGHPEPCDEPLRALADVADPARQYERTKGGTDGWRAACWEMYGSQIYDELVKAHAEIENLRSASPPAGDEHLQALRSERNLLGEAVAAVCEALGVRNRAVVDPGELVGLVKAIRAQRDAAQAQVNKLHAWIYQHLPVFIGTTDPAEIVTGRITEAWAELGRVRGQRNDLGRRLGAAERDLAEARREAERLRAETAKIADWCEDMSDNAALPHGAIGEAALRLRALASTGGSDTTGGGS